MKFDNIENYREHCMIKVDDKAPCVICGDPTNFIDYCFESRLCSEECQRKLTDLVF